MTHRYYRYGYLLRPPGPGCQPNDGLVRTREQEGATPDGYHLWGFAIYDRPLPDNVADHYDLVFLDSWVFNGPIPDNFRPEGERA